MTHKKNDGNVRPDSDPWGALKQGPHVILVDPPDIATNAGLEMLRERVDAQESRIRELADKVEINSNQHVPHSIFNATPLPDAAYGGVMSRSEMVGDRSLWYKPTDYQSLSDPPEDRVRFLAQLFATRGVRTICIDGEYAGKKWYNDDPSDVRQTYSRLSRVADWMNREEFGIFNVPMGVGQTWQLEDDEYLRQRWENRALFAFNDSPLGEKLAYAAPGIYAWTDDTNIVEQQVHRTVEVARKTNKPVYPFISACRKGPGNEIISEKAFRTLIRTTLRDADGLWLWMPYTQKSGQWVHVFVDEVKGGET